VKPIDPAEVQQYARVGVKQETIAALMGCSVRTLHRRCKAELTRGRAEFECDLRQWQYDLAKEKNATMLKWLGQIELGQTEKGRCEKGDEDGEPEPRLDPKVG
jgi:AraC-like DNA-binding protein